MPMPVKFKETEIGGVLEVECGLFRDDRGFFSESYSQAMWAAAKFSEDFVQDSMSLSAKGVLRGMHYQLEPHGMGKLVRAVAGAIFDVAVDLRSGSPWFGKWVGRELTAENHLALWIPPGFAHGFVALQDGTVVYYKCSSIHAPEAERSLSYACPTVGIAWPLTPSIVSKKDAEAPGLEAAERNFTYRR